MKKVASIILITSMLLSVMIIKPLKQAEAIAIEYPISVCMTMLLAAGMKYTNPDSANTAATTIYNGLSQTAKDNLNYAIVAGTLAYSAGSVWVQEMKTQIGQYTSTRTDGSVNASVSPTSAHKAEFIAAHPGYSLYALVTALNAGGNAVIYFMLPNAYPMASNEWNASMVGARIFVSTTSTQWYYILYPENPAGSLIRNETSGYVSSAGSYSFYINGNFPNGAFASNQYSISQPVSNLLTGEDATNQQDVRQVGFPIPDGTNIVLPKDSTEIVNKTINDISTTTAPPTDVTNDTGILRSISTTLKSIKTAVTNITDTTTPINMEPLKLSGEIFTTRFPFSLPWDLMRSFQLFNDNSFNPVLNVNIPAGPILPNMDFNIDLSVWSSIVGYVKALELLIFDITLVLMTRKLLGGGV